MSEDVVVVEDPPPESVSVVGDSPSGGDITVVEGGSETVVVIEAGSQGDPGAPGKAGPPGEQGPAGPPGADVSFIHNQAMLSKVWTVVHNLDRHPAVFVEDAAGSVMYATINYVSNNVLTLEFNTTTTGRANCT